MRDMKYHFFIIFFNGIFTPFLLRNATEVFLGILRRRRWRKWGIRCRQVQIGFFFSGELVLLFLCLAPRPFISTTWLPQTEFVHLHLSLLSSFHNCNFARWLRQLQKWFSPFILAGQKSRYAELFSKFFQLPSPKVLQLYVFFIPPVFGFPVLFLETKLDES